MVTRSGDIVSALRVVAAWLLMLCVCFGPGRFGASVAFAAALFPALACGTACPCAGVSKGSHAELHAGAVPNETCAGEQQSHPDYRPGDPCTHDCSDTCPTCACCVGAAMAVFPLALTSQTTTWSRVHIFAAVEAPAWGSRTRVFRPPRVSG